MGTKSPALLLLGLLAFCRAQDPALSGTGVTILSGTHSAGGTELATPTGPYESVSSTITLATTLLATTGIGSIGANGTQTSQSVTFLTGSITSAASTSSSPTAGASSSSSSASSSSPAGATPTNTQPCNGHPAFCSRKYSNITMVSAHNSPFVQPGSAAANQQFNVTYQLNDGVRFLQAQMQWPDNGTEPHFCHTTCDLLDAGPITFWLGQVVDWVKTHPYDVVTILLENGNYSKPELYVPFIESTGILQYVYTPPVTPMSLDDWPTLGSMILHNQRVVMFLDYEANQTAYPWWLDEFSQMWETPFDPTDTSFPCVVQRPPDLSDDDAAQRLSLMNHNLNVEVSLLGDSILVPAVSVLNITNNVSGPGSLGSAASICQIQWARPPNVLNVDYYNFGDPPGSVFQVAALLNNVNVSLQLKQSKTIK